MIDKVTNYCATHGLLTYGAHVLIGLSGGPDSRCLLDVLYRLKSTYSLTLSAAHLDHEWRPSSGEDRNFCHALCQSYDIPLYTAQLSEIDMRDTPKEATKGSHEAFARHARRTFLSNVRHQIDADVIALAHHEDDAIATFFIRLARGTSIDGLTGMSPAANGYIRPLLGVSRNEIETYLSRNNMSFCTDPSNTSMAFLRNRIRQYVMPALDHADTRFRENILRTMTSLSTTNDYLAQETDHYLKACTEPRTHGGTALNIRAAQALHPYMYARVLIAWLQREGVRFAPSQRFIEEIQRFFANTKSKRHIVKHAWAIVKHKGFAHVASIT